ncbi:MAG: DUF3987 domain-containing protein [Nostoc sp. CmiVER01]|uniref:DUF3987 domain-containing protein n=1 Tax=Nostoc sp. CmiVER01 TaxID=3075384 RepID=UPI002AD254D4|nr:DUF3987 domain-containing protein [Nostoc sp. CmiVER01]MDZ8126664.1 DUF3987 domain-containing protein [Nostoc sp. CmiVER01]
MKFNITSTSVSFHSNDTPCLWTSDLSSIVILAGRFATGDLLNVPQTLSPGMHIILVDRDTPEAAVWQGIYRILASGNSPEIYETQLPIATLAADESSSPSELAGQIVEFSQLWEKWLERRSQNKLTLQEAVQIAQVVITYESGSQLNTQLGMLRVRCGENSYDWNKIIWKLKKEQLLPVEKSGSVEKAIGSSDTSLLAVPPVTVDSYESKEIKAIGTAVTGILSSNLSDIQESFKLDLLCTESGINPKLFEKIVARERVRLDEVSPEDEMRLKALMDWDNTQIDWEAILPAPLARDLIHDADVLNVDPVVIWQPLMAAVASLGGTKTNLLLGSRRIPSVLWSVVVLESGGGKTRADSLVVAPLRKMQADAMERYQEEYKTYEQELKARGKEQEDEEMPVPPILRKLMYDVATIQAVLKRSSENKGHGALWARDEIAGLFNSLGQFSKGDDESLQVLLKLWDAAGICVDRVGVADSYFADKTAISLSGGIQPGVFRKIFSDADDSNGLQARILFAVAKARRQRYVEGFCQLSERLPLLYQFLEELPETNVELSPEAKAYYKKVVDVLGNQIEETVHPAIRTWMSKLPTQILRIALNLHLIEQFYSPSKNVKVLTKQTLERAVRLGQYYRSAFHVLQEKVSNSDEISTILLQICDRASKSKDGVSARDIYRPLNSIKTRAKAAGREVAAYTQDLFNKLVEMGYGLLTRVGRCVKFIALKQDSSENAFRVSDTTATDEENGLDCLSAEEVNVSDNHCQELSVTGANSTLHLDHGEEAVIDESEIMEEAIPSVEAESDNSYSLLQFEQDGGDVEGFIGCQVEVRSLSGVIKFIGEMVSFNLKNGFITLMTEEGNKDVDFREVFVMG